MIRAALAFGLVLLFSSNAAAEKLRICIGDFPPYEIGSDHLTQAPESFAVTRTTVLACMRRFKAGHFDLILSDSFISISEFFRSPTYRIVSLVDYSDGADVVMSTHDIPAEGLRGTEWALETNTLSTLLLGFYLEKNRLSLKDVKTTFVRGENTTSAMTSKRFFGIVTWPPHSLDARNRGAKILASTADFELKAFDVVVSNKAAIQAKGPLIKAYLQARISAGANMDAVHQSYARLKKIPLEEAKENFLGFKFYRSADEIRRDKDRLIESTQAGARFFNQMHPNVTLNPDDIRTKVPAMIDFSLLPDH